MTLYAKRIGSVRLHDPSLAEFDSSVIEKELRELAAEPRVERLQSSEPVKKDVWALLNKAFFSLRPDVELRVYGYSAEYDLSFASIMTNVRRFSADCLLQAKNVDAISEIPRLESLSLGVFNLTDFSILESVPATLSRLSLHPTKSKKPTLAPLSRFSALRTVYLDSQSKEIDVLSELRELEDVTLRSVKSTDLEYLSGLEKLWSLDIKLGSIPSLHGIENKKSIKYLELWRIRDLRDIDAISSLTGLQNLFLQTLQHIKSVPSLAKCRELRRVVIDNLKALRDFSGLEKASALEEFGLSNGRPQEPKDLLPVLRNRDVRGVNGFFGSDRKNREFARLRDEHGKVEWDQSVPFVYQQWHPK